MLLLLSLSLVLRPGAERPRSWWERPRLDQDPRWAPGCPLCCKLLLCPFQQPGVQHGDPQHLLVLRPPRGLQSSSSKGGCWRLEFGVKRLGGSCVFVEWL